LFRNDYGCGSNFSFMNDYVDEDEEGEKNIRRRWFTIKYNRLYKIQQCSFKEKIKKVYGGPPLNMVQLRYLILKTIGEDQNSKQQKIYKIKLREN